jgi:hypothetical protein
VTSSLSTATSKAHQHLAGSDPVISVDTKKKELTGQYKNG